MVKLLSKKILDEELLKELVKYYRINTSSEEWDSDKFVEWECFSHPSLNYHDCNYRSKLLGGHSCEFCNHLPERPCKYSCDFQHFCLAVFAWRLGIGGEDLNEALNNNLYILKREELFEEVVKVFSMEAIEDCESCEDYEATEEEDFVEEVEVLEKKDKKLLTVKEAADYYGCTYANIYNYIIGGKLPYVEDNGKKKVVKSDLEDFKASRSRNIRGNKWT